MRHVDVDLDVDLDVVVDVDGDGDGDVAVNESPRQFREHRHDSHIGRGRASER
jgi:hypothetical protein